MGCCTKRGGEDAGECPPPPGGTLTQEPRSKQPVSASKRGTSADTAAAKPPAANTAAAAAPPAEPTPTTAPATKPPLAKPPLGVKPRKNTPQAATASPVIAGEEVAKRALQQLYEAQRDVLLSQYYRGLIDAVAAEEAAQRGRHHACEAECRLALCGKLLDEKSRLMVVDDDDERALRPATANEEATERALLLIESVPLMEVDDICRRKKINHSEAKQRCELLSDYFSAQRVMALLKKGDAERRLQLMELFCGFAQVEEQILQHEFGDGSTADAEPQLPEAPPDAELSYVFGRCAEIKSGKAVRRQMNEWHSKLEQLANESVELSKKCNGGNDDGTEPQLRDGDQKKRRQRLIDCISEYEQLREEILKHNIRGEDEPQLREASSHEKLSYVFEHYAQRLMVVFRNSTKDCIFSLCTGSDVVERELLPGEEHTTCDANRKIGLRSIGCALGKCVRDLIEQEEAAIEKYKGLPLEGTLAMCVASHACEGGCLKFVDCSFYKPSLPRDDEAPELTLLRPGWLRPWGLPVALCLPFSNVSPHMSEVCQGGLGDCWMIATLASIAHSHPELIRSIFFPYPMRAAEQRVGAFRLLLCVDGWWRCVVVDDLLPADATSLRYGHCSAHPGVLWAPLIEKAMAKVFGGYDALKGNDPRFAFQYLLGLPSTRLSFDGKDQTLV